MPSTALRNTGTFFWLAISFTVKNSLTRSMYAVRLSLSGQNSCNWPMVVYGGYHLVANVMSWVFDNKNRTTATMSVQVLTQNDEQ